ncbi:hypothetical protein Bbelb_376340 [Branchiostoma belcheri]|nr:hypothetical protein Bbelb_376340 [Branchiostoma belcheri]
MHSGIFHYRKAMGGNKAAFEVLKLSLSRKSRFYVLHKIWTTPGQAEASGLKMDPSPPTNRVDWSTVPCCYSNHSKHIPTPPPSVLSAKPRVCLCQEEIFLWRLPVFFS